ncbi:MAG: ankyrin repeat domain-containing protein [Litorimonas sp.]
MEETIIQQAYSQPDEKLLPLINDYLARDGDIDYQTKYGESLLGVTFRFQKLSSFRNLVDQGADDTPLGWPEGFMEIALSDAKISNVSSKINPKIRNQKGLTPFLFAVSLGHQNIAEMLLPLTEKEGLKGGRNNYGAIYFAAEHQHGDMIDWLISKGFDVNEASSFGETALFTAVEWSAPHTVNQLVDAGADVNVRHNLSSQLKAFPPNYEGYDPSLESDDYETIFTPMSQANDPETALLLYRAGAPLKELSDDDVRRKVIGAANIQKQTVGEKEFDAHKYRKFGRSNPEVTNHSFWLEQIRTHDSGFTAFEKYSPHKRDYSRPATWSFSRFGQSITELPDGRWLLIAGEHEDSYDPDFCIYNDVVVIDPNGDEVIYSYPEEVFQPTDFHTSTLVKDTVLIIGNLGYFGKRNEGSTPVYSLDLQTFEISKLQTNGEGPGWISRHDAKKIDRKIVISGGQVWRNSDLISNNETWELSLDELKWTKKN